MSLATTQSLKLSRLIAPAHIPVSFVLFTFVSLSEFLQGAMRERAIRNYGYPPSDPEPYSLWLTAVSPLCGPLKVELLSSSNTVSRIKACLGALADFNQRLGERQRGDAANGASGNMWSSIVGLSGLLGGGGNADGDEDDEEQNEEEEEENEEEEDEEGMDEGENVVRQAEDTVGGR